MDGEPLAVHDVTVKETRTFDARGGVVKRMQVTYYVGDHGPFSAEYSLAEYNADRVNQDIQNQVATLQRIAQAAHSGPGY